MRYAITKGSSKSFEDHNIRRKVVRTMRGSRLWPVLGLAAVKLFACSIRSGASAKAIIDVCYDQYNMSLTERFSLMTGLLSYQNVSGFYSGAATCDFSSGTEFQLQ